MRPGGVHRGGAPRSELVIIMIAGGNHTKINRATWIAAAPAGTCRAQPGISPALGATLSKTYSAAPMTASFGSFLAGARKEWLPDGKINNHLSYCVRIILLHKSILCKGAFLSETVVQKILDSGEIICYNMEIMNRKGVDFP